MQKRSTDNTGQLGVNAVEAIFLKMGWIFRHQFESDFGIDAQVEICDAAESPTGQLIGIQIKSGPSFFRKKGDHFVFYGEPRHLDYWDRHSLPVILVLHNPEDGMTLWRRIERHTVDERESGRWSVTIPEWRTLDESCKTNIEDSLPRSDPESTRRNRMALDAPLIRQIAEEEQAYVSIDQWVNKTLNYRGASISFDEPDGKVAYYAAVAMVADNPSEMFDLLFPWLDFEYVDMPEEDSSGEVMTHIFQVTLNALGRAFLQLEDFYRDGPEPSPPAEIDEPTGILYDDEQMEAMEFAHAQQADWEEEAKQGRDDEPF